MGWPSVSSAYRTVAAAATAKFVVQGSEFIGHVRPVDSVPAAEAFVEAVEDEYADATHNVPAYRVRDGDDGTDGHFLREYSSDDGEPSGSAGKPALNVLTQQELENCAVVVTRYYGGTNLGVGGSSGRTPRAVKEAVEEAGVVAERPHEQLAITVAYDDSGTVRSILESEGYEFEADYEAEVSFDVRVPARRGRRASGSHSSATSGRADIE